MPSPAHVQASSWPEQPMPSVGHEKNSPCPAHARPNRAQPSSAQPSLIYTHPSQVHAQSRTCPAQPMLRKSITSPPHAQPSPCKTHPMSGFACTEPNYCAAHVQSRPRPAKHMPRAIRAYLSPFPDQPILRLTHTQTICPLEQHSQAHAQPEYELPKSCTTHARPIPYPTLPMPDQLMTSTAKPMHMEAHDQPLQSTSQHTPSPCTHHAVHAQPIPSPWQGHA